MREKKFKARLQDGATWDIENIQKYKGRRSSVAAPRIIGKILKRLRALETAPYSGRVSEYDPDYREVFVEDYTVLYLVDERREAIYVDFILHQSRNIEYIVKTGDRSFEVDFDSEL